VVLSTYILQVRRLLHDLNVQYWTDSELTDYINEGRNRVCKDTRCLRVQIPSLVTLTQGTEQYSLSTIQASSAFTTNWNGYSIIDVMGINILWGTTRIKLAQLGWDRFDAQFRYWSSMQSRPVCYTRMGSLNIYIGPQPDQSYVSDWDVALQPPVLSSDTTPEPIPDPFTTPVKYYAAKLAKFRAQAIGESDMFSKMYVAQVKTEAVAFMGRYIPNFYAQ
jgi:hypothetical protein